MLRALFGWRKPAADIEARSSVPDGHFVAAIGDLHGRLDLFEILWPKIETASRISACRQRTLIFIGDYVDRGNASSQLVARLLDGFPGFDTVFLKGNHDETLLQFLADPKVGDIWRNFGGLETLSSYGVVHAPGKEWVTTRNEFASALPPAHLQFFKNLKLQAVIGDYVFVHAGLKPYVALDQQRESDLLWIREEFLESRANFGRIVVHGHTPAAAPVVRHNRIGIDTGAYMSGRLTALVLEGRNRQFLTTD